MDTGTPSSGPKRAYRTTELSDDDVPLAVRRKASRLSYNELKGGYESNSGVSNKVEPDNDPEIIRCICGDNGPDKESAFISCDGCGVWQHLECVGFSGNGHDAPDKYFCEQCGPYGKLDAGFGKSPQSALPMRSRAPGNMQSRRGLAGKKQTLNELTKTYYNGALSMKKSKKRVSLSSDVQPASTSGEEDGYNPSNEAISDDDDDEYAGDLSEEDSEDIFIPQSQRSRRSEDDSQNIFIPQSRSTSNGTKKAAPNKKGTPNKNAQIPGISDDIVKKWMEGGYADEFAESEAGSDAGSDVSEIEIPDMSEGADLLKKLSEQEQLIFALKSKLEKRGNAIKKLRAQLRELEKEKRGPGGDVDSVMNGK